MAEAPKTSVWATISGLLLAGWLVWMVFGERTVTGNRAARLRAQRKSKRKGRS